MKRNALFLVLVSVIIGFVACQRDDDEPVVAERSISRLYISTSDYDGSAGENFYNVYVVDPADSSSFPPIDSIYKFRSAAKGGRFITYTPYNSGLVFQGSQNSSVDIDTAIQVMTVSKTGVMSNRSLLSNRKFNNIRGLAYSVEVEGNITGDYLLALNANVISDTLFTIPSPSREGRYTKPRFYLPLKYNTWGIHINGRDVFLTSYTPATANANKPNAFNGIVVQKGLMTNILSNPLDSMLTVPSASTFNLTINGANNVRGIAYSKTSDLLVVTDYSGTGAESVGRILFFEKFSTYTSTQEIKPDRVITSSGTLKQPLDVAIDTREGAKYIYVADAIAKKVYRYLISDNGEVLPNVELVVQGRTPQSITLDAR